MEGILDEKRMELNGEKPDEFTHGQIIVESPYPIQAVTELEITGKLNQHGRVLVKGILWNEKGKGCIRQVGERDSICVYGENDSGKTLLFSGVVTSVEVTFRDCIYYVEIVGLSWSSLLDYEEKSRSFQDKAMSYSGLIRQVLKDYPGSSCLSQAESFHEPLGEFILQYRETDWEFIRRMAARLGTQVTADVMGDVPRFWLGLPGNHGEIKTLVASESRVENGKFHIKSKDRLLPGDMVEYQGRSLVVEECRFYLEKGVLCYACLLGPEASLPVSGKENRRIQGISLLGEVLDRKDAQVKVKLDIDESQEAESACWFPYASQADSLFYCMPEIGTSVSLYFSGCDENGGIAVNAVRKNGGSCSKTSNPGMKYMGIPQGKEFKLGPTDINFEATEKLFLKMDAENGVSIRSHENLSVFTRQKLYLEAKELVKLFAKTGELVVGAKAVSSLSLLGGADGNTLIKAGNKLVYDGRKKEVFTERLNEEKKFPWGKLFKNVLIGLAAVALVVAVVATGGAALVAAGVVAQATVAAAAVGAAVSGTIAVGAMAVSDVARGEVSDWQDYALTGVKAAVEGAIEGAVLGTGALAKAGLLMKMFAGGCTAFVTDAISQMIDILFKGGSYNWMQGLLSFGIGFFMPAVAALMRKGLRSLLARYGKKMPAWLRNGFCKLAGDPVDLISGNVVYDAIDFELPGPMPLQWHRIWCSASQVAGHLGHGTRYNYEIGLEVLEEESAVAVFWRDGRACIFPDILTGEEFFSPENKLLLKKKPDRYQIFEPESGYTYNLCPHPGGYLPYKLTSIQNRKDHEIRFSYDSRGFLCEITDSAGRKLDVTADSRGRIVQVALRGEEGGEASHTLVSYGYGREQDLETAADGLGARLCLEYRNHLLIKKTDRNLHSFYWEYDRYEDGARAVRTWGDGGLLSLWIDYHDKEGYNAVRTGAGASEYHYNDKMLCTRVVYPDMTETREEYNDNYQLVSQVDEEGRMILYRYNHWSQITSITFADGSKKSFAYDSAGRLVQAVDGEGGVRKWIYGGDGLLEKTVDPAGMETAYRYNSHRLVEKIIYPNQEEICLGYDRHFNITRATLPDGSFSTWEYDRRGNCVTAVNPLGGADTYRYDPLNRMVEASLADGNEIRLVYDGYDGVLHAEDKQRKVDYTYTPLGNISSKIQEGRKTVCEYDSEERLVSVTNEKGEVYRFERDAKGNIRKEVGFDNLVRTYERDASGLVTKMNRPGDRFTRYSYDKLGQVVRKDYHDGTYEIFTYDKNGAVTEAENQDVKVKLERDKLGRITKEWQDCHWVFCEYDKVGDRVWAKSSFGAEILTGRNSMGQAVRFTAYGEIPLEAEVEYNVLGQEAKWQFSGGVCSTWEYDCVGRPLFHQVVVGREGAGSRDVPGFSETSRRRRYEWDVNNQLKKTVNELTKDTAVFSYDRIGNLVSARESGFDTIFRTADDVGNLYETPDGSDRIYGAGSRLEQSGIDRKEKRNPFQGGYGKFVTKGTKYFYDQEGNLERKEEPEGGIWTYEYFGNGMLKKVTRPDKSRISFRYDVFGRRVEKSLTGAADRDGTADRELRKVTRFLWDKNTLLHEWEEELSVEGRAVTSRVDYQAKFVQKREEKALDMARQKAGQGEKPPENLVTWIFQDDFAPRGKITREGSFCIVSDYLGTPVAAYDKKGQKVWERELDIYGRIKPGRKDVLGVPKEEAGERNFIPFRFPGQYEDEETGLYYNRFRYYSPADGCYTQQDPIGLAGGNPTLYGFVRDTNARVDLFGLRSFYRSMNRAEYYDIVRNGWRGAGTMEGKWFAETYEDAVEWGQQMGHNDSKFYVVEVDIPDDVVNKAERSSNLDGIGDAAYFKKGDLNESATIKSRNSVRADPDKCKFKGKCK